MSSITEKARAEAERVCTIAPSASMGARLWTTRHMHDFGVRMAAFGYAARAAEEPSDEQVAQIIDQHRLCEKSHAEGTFNAWCMCEGWEQAGHKVNLRHVPALHSAHVAAQLRAARDTGEQA